MARQRSRRQLVKIIVFSVLIFTFYHLFSPWKIVIQIRPANEKIESDRPAEAVLVKQDSHEQHQAPPKNDEIEENFGQLEEAFLKAAKEPSSEPKRSRDESIKLIYNVKSSDDWLNLIEGHDSHGLLALTKVTQRYIYDKQNPPRCDAQRFLVLNHFPSDLYGIGALFQHIADYLSVAIQTNSILLYAEDHPPGQNFVQDPQHGGDKTCGRSMDCILQPLSKCKTEKQRGLDDKTRSIFVGEDVHVDAQAYLNKYGSPIPPVFEKALREVQPDITGEMLKYWWRAQAAAYLMRLNGKTAKRMKELRLGKDVAQLGIQFGDDGEARNTAMPFPMPEGTFSLHVRHGDKGSEMRLVPFNNYVVEAEKFGAMNPLGYWKRGFVSTEDPNVIEQMKSMARISSFDMSGSNARWTWYWSDIPRLNTGPETQLAQFGDRTELTIKWLLQLVMAIECDAFIGTRGSGWNRLIDSLRCVWLASCKQPFIEVGFENDWAGYGP